MRKEILQEHVITIGGQQILPYAVGARGDHWAKIVKQRAIKK
jgi:hypothetical protein